MLAQAREKAKAARDLLADGIDPIAARDRDQAIPTFAELVADYVAAHASTWRNEKHRRQWTTSLETHAQRIWRMPVDQITKDDVFAVLEPIWQVIPETASRVRGRIETILDTANARDLRSGDNPARWRGNLDHRLGKRPKLTRRHMPAMPVDDIPAFVASIQGRNEVSARCLEFLILTAARGGEATGARWSEVDLVA